MGVMNSSSMGAMGSLLWKLSKLLHTQDGAKDTIGQLRDNVVSIRTKLEELSAVQDPPLTVNYWMKDARELSYDMEDCVDQFILAESDGNISLIDEISGFRTRLEEVIDRYHRFKLEYAVSYPTATITVANRSLRTVGDIPNRVSHVGMEGPKNELLGWLKPKHDDENELQLKVISILGGGGIGKSTIAQELWRILGEDFECKAFVQASKKPDIRTILKSILLQVHQKQLQEVCQVPKLINHISKHLQNKRYFIVIDDLWTVSIWDTISRAFPEGNSCSRIITTTTTEDVALACCSYDPGHIFKMKSLCSDHSKELFIRTVFGSAKGCPQQFHEISDEITRKCGGLPLAITCIASLLASQRKNFHQWDYISNFLGHNLRTNPTSMEIMKQVLNLCYHNLPHSLKSCLLYLSVYPENYLILKDDLVKQWIAEDFICASMQEKDPGDVARCYFDELVNLGLIQRTHTNCIKKGRSYVVHPMVFDFVTRKSGEDNFITTIDYSQSRVTQTDKVRRLSLHFGSATYASTPACIGLSQVRSLTFIGLLGCMPSLVEFKLVRVMILHLQGEDSDTSLHLKEICGLLLLRYLLVSCSFVAVELPDKLGGLKHLETLEINAEVAAAPSDIVHHPSLLHVRLGTNSKHKHLTLGSVTSKNAVFPDVLSCAPSSAVQVLELLPPICSFSRLPGWLRRLRELRSLEVVVRELGTYDVIPLKQLPVLTVLSLYVQKPSSGSVITFYRRDFPVLRYFKIVSGFLLLNFRQEALPNLRRLEIGFNVHRWEEYDHVLGGVHHLLNLQEVAASIGVVTGAEETERIAAETALQDAIGNHPRVPSFNVTRVDPIDEENDPPPSEIQDWSQETESSNKQNKDLKTHGACKEDLPNHQPVLAETPGELMKKLADTSYEPHQTQELEKGSPHLLLLATLVAIITYNAGLSPPRVFWQYHGDGHKTGEPILSSGWYKAFFYCNSVAFVASLVTIISLQVAVLPEHQALEATMILDFLGFIGACIAASGQDLRTYTYHIIMDLAGIVLVIILVIVTFQAALLMLDPDTAFVNRLILTMVKEILMERWHNFLLLAFLVVIFHQGDLSQPSSFWYGPPGLHDSDAALLYDYLLRNKETFLYWNSISSMVSVPVFILIYSNLLRPTSQSNVLYFVGVAAGVYSAVVAYIVGSMTTTQHERTSTINPFSILVPVGVFFVQVGLFLLFWPGKAHNNSASVVGNAMASNPAPVTEDGNGARYTTLMLGIQTATVTSETFLAVLLGVVWQGDHSKGNSVMHNWRPRSLIFLYSSSFCFVASIIIIAMLMLVQLLHHDNKWWLRARNTLIVLDLLSLLVAYLAGSCRLLKTIEYVSALVVAALAYFAIRVMLSFFSTKSKAPAAETSASHAN